MPILLLAALGGGSYRDRQYSDCYMHGKVQVAHVKPVPPLLYDLYNNNVRVQPDLLPDLGGGSLGHLKGSGNTSSAGLIYTAVPTSEKMQGSGLSC